MHVSVSSQCGRSPGPHSLPTCSLCVPLCRYPRQSGDSVQMGCPGETCLPSVAQSPSGRVDKEGESVLVTLVVDQRPWGPPGGTLAGL